MRRGAEGALEGAQRLQAGNQVRGGCGAGEGECDEAGGCANGDGHARQGAACFTRLIIGPVLHPTHRKVRDGWGNRLAEREKGQDGEGRGETEQLEPAPLGGKPVGSRQRDADVV
jgi:hypothetical protein